MPNAEKPTLNDADWRQVDLPHDWSIEEPFDEQWASATAYLPGGIAWYRKTFKHENGVMAFGFDITDVVNVGDEKM